MRICDLCGTKGDASEIFEVRDKYKKKGVCDLCQDCKEVFVKKTVEIEHKADKEFEKWRKEMIAKK